MCVRNQVLYVVGILCRDMGILITNEKLGAMKKTTYIGAEQSIDVMILKSM